MRRADRGMLCLFAAVVAASGVTARAAEELKTVRLVLHPAAEPRPALKYLFLPDVFDCHPGNAALLYEKTALEVAAHRAGKKAEETKELEQITAWLSMPLDKLPRAEVRAAVDEYRWPLDELGRATRRTECNWQLPIREQNWISLLLPDLSELRMAARVLALEARLQIAEGHSEAAVQSLQTGYALARHLGTANTLIHALVGVSIAAMMNEQVRELVQQPHQANLYWALAWLPQPLVNFRPALETERDDLYWIIPALRHADAAGVRAADINELLRTMQLETQTVSDAAPAPWIPLTATLAAIQGYPEARRALVAQGRRPEEVDALPVIQVVAMHIAQTHDELRDELFKWLMLPYWQMPDLGPVTEHITADARRREILPITSLLLPALGRVRWSEVRCQRELAALQTVEALRMYAAAHAGKLPAALDAVREVPPPIDPVYGRPFRYQLQGETAVLESPAPNVKRPQDGLRYEIHMETR